MHRLASARPSRRSRALLVIGLVVAHLGLILLIALQRSAAPRPAQGGMALIAVSADPAPATPPPAHPIKTPAPPRLVLVQTDLALPPASSATPSAAPGDGSSCALAIESSGAILASSAALAELAAFPAGVRTPADAVMMWDGGWLDPGPLPQGVSAGAIRQIIEQVVASAPPDCRDRPQVGPQFLPIRETGRTTMLVIGSGAWRWADLIEPNPACTVDKPTQCAPPPDSPRPATN